MRVVLVCADEEDAEVAQKVLERRVPGIRTYVDATGLGVVRYQIQALPTLWLIGPNGEAIGRCTGNRDWRSAESRAVLERFLPKPERERQKIGSP